VNRPNRPEPHSKIPGVPPPPPPPELNARRLWITLLAPSGVMLALFFFVGCLAIIAIDGY
jgi:hypothetical protein